MPAVSPEALQEIAYSIYDYVDNTGNPFIIDRKKTPFWSMLQAMGKDAPAVNGIITVKYKRDGGLTIQHWEGKDRLAFEESRIDFDLVFDFTQSHMGVEVPHQELKDAGYTIVPNGPRGKSFATKISKANAFRLVNLLEEKIEDMMDGWDREQDVIWHRDGTQSTLAPAGLDAMLPLDNTSGLLGTKSRANALLQHHVILNSTVSAGGSLIPDLTTLRRNANLNSRGFKGEVDVMFAGAAWIDAYVDYCRNNGLTFENQASGTSKVDFGIPDTAICFEGIPIVHNPTFDALVDIEGDATWTKRCYGLNSKTWKFYSTPGENKQFSAPLDPFDQRLSHMSLDGHHALALIKPNANFVNTVA